jgi:FAD synthase
MGKFILFFYIVLFICLSTNAQKITINGFVEDKETGERLIGATIYNSKTGKGTITNSFGFYSITLNKSDTIYPTASFVGYNSKKNILSPVNDTIVNFYLIQANYIDEVIISGERYKNIEKTVSMSTVQIPIKQINSLPSLMG